MFNWKQGSKWLTFHRFNQIVRVTYSQLSTHSCHLHSLYLKLDSITLSVPRTTWTDWESEYQKIDKQFSDLYINQVSCRVSWSLLHAKVYYRLQIQLLFQCYRRFMQHFTDKQKLYSLTVNFVTTNKATGTSRSFVVTIQRLMHFTSRSHEAWPGIRLPACTKN